MREGRGTSPDTELPVRGWGRGKGLPSPNQRPRGGQGASSEAQALPSSGSGHERLDCAGDAGEGRVGRGEHQHLLLPEVVVLLTGGAPAREPRARPRQSRAGELSTARTLPMKADHGARRIRLR